MDLYRPEDIFLRDDIIHGSVMQKTIRWLPAFGIMLVIYYFSAQPSAELPNFGWADYLFKKGGHFTVYALLALSFWYAFEWKVDWRWLAWLLAFLYAATDEFHQSFVPGRHPSVWDVVIFDNFGALVALWVVEKFMKQKRPDKNI